MYKKVINSQKEMLAWSWVLHYLHYLHGPPVEEAGPTCVLLPWLRSPWDAKKLFRFHEESYHFGLFMIGLRLESLNGIKPCISTNACMGKESHFILIKQYHFIQKKSATVQQATAILDWNPTFYLQFSRNPQLFYILKQGSHGDFAVFFNCLCSVVSS